MSSSAHGRPLRVAVASRRVAAAAVLPVEGRAATPAQAAAVATAGVLADPVHGQPLLIPLPHGERLLGGVR